MLYSIDSSIFKGRVAEDPFNWSSRLPDMDAQKFLSIGGFEGIIASAGGTELSVSYFDLAAKSSVFAGIRNCMGYVASAYGYFQSAVGAVRTIFKSPLLDLVREVSEAVMSAVELAVNTISSFPVVGWIIKILFEIADTIFGIVKAVRQKAEQKDQKALNDLAREGFLPMAFPSPDADTIFGRTLQNSILDLNVEWMIRPQYLATKAGDFFVTRQRAGGGESGCTDAYLIQSNKTGGLGFMPGSVNIHSAMELHTRTGGLIRDIGQFFPVTQSMSANVWGQILKGDSGLTFAIDTDNIAPQWSDYVRAAMEFSTEKVSRGWSTIKGTLSQSNIYDSEHYTCTSCDRGRTSCTDWKGANKDHMKTRGIAGTGHESVLSEYYAQIFDWGRVNSNKAYTMDNIDWDDIAPNRSLNELRARQEAMINSPKCMYLDDSTNAAGTGQQRFKAITKGSPLHELWEDNVQAMFESGDWKRIDYRDVIKGEEVDQALHNTTGNMQTTPDKFFNMDSPSAMSRGRAAMKFAGEGTGPSVLGDPTPPPASDQVDFTPPRLGFGGSSKKASEGMSTGAKVAIGGVVAALGYYGYTRFVK